jgi:hypothetical protein
VTGKNSCRRPARVVDVVHKVLDVAVDHLPALLELSDAAAQTDDLGGERHDRHYESDGDYGQLGRLSARWPPRPARGTIPHPLPASSSATNR